MNCCRSSVTTRPAVEGARKAFWNALERHGRTVDAHTAGNAPWSPAGLKRFLDDPAAAAVAERL